MFSRSVFSNLEKILCMQQNQVPERIAYLILMYMHQLISPEQHDELDTWVEYSDENMKMFEDLTDVKSVTAFYYH